MDPGSPSAGSLGRPGIRMKWLVVGGLWPVVGPSAAAEPRLLVQHGSRISLGYQPRSSGDTDRGSLWQVVGGLWWGYRQQRNHGFAFSMDPELSSGLVAGSRGFVASVGDVEEGICGGRGGRWGLEFEGECRWRAGLGAAAFGGSWRVRLGRVGISRRGCV